MRRPFLFLSSLMVLMSIIGCTDRVEEDMVDTRQIIIEASIPADAVKAGFNGENAKHVYWKAGDALRVFNHKNPANNSEFTIQEGFTDHWARFSGSIPSGVAGGKYDIITPSWYASVLDAEAGDYELTQTGNDNPAHLVFTAKLSNVAEEDIANITFSDAWVAAHDGTSLNRGAVIKINATLPAAITEPKRVALSGIGYREVSVKVTGIDSSSDKNLVVYLQYGWDNLNIPASTNLNLYVQDADGRNWKITKATPAAAILKAGAVNILNFTSGSWTEELFAGGDGTEGNPYQIATATQLNNMRSVLVGMQMIHFRIIKDIDMADWNADHLTTPWVPLNGKGTGYDNGVVLDGGGHTITNFKCVRSASNSGDFNHCALFGVLYGEVHDLKFTNASIDQQTTNNYGAAVIASYCGYTSGGANGQPAHVYNVDVEGTVKNAGHFTGGIAAMADDAIIESCSANVHVWSNGKNCVGGILGVDDDNNSGDSRKVRPSTIRNCWTSGTVRGSQKIGGIVGCIGGQSNSQVTHYSQVINCYSTAKVCYDNWSGDVSVASGGSRHVGGIVGMATLSSTGGTNPETVRPDNRVQGCIAWQTTISENLGSETNAYSCGAIIGYTATHNYLINCWRNPAMEYDYYGFSFTDQNDANPDTPLTGVPLSGKSNSYPYNGKIAANSRLSTVAQSIGWSAEVWDFSGDTPQFKVPRKVETVPAKASDPSTLSSYASSTDRAAGAQYPVIGEINWKGKSINAANWTIEEVSPGITYYHYENAADTDFASDSEEARFTDESTKQTVYYHYSGQNTFTAGATHQNVFVVDIDLNRRDVDYEVKIVRTSNEVPASYLHNKLGALVTINGGYERTNIAERDNAYLYTTGWKTVDDVTTWTTHAKDNQLDLYPNGYRAAIMANDEIKTGITNWKSQGTFYCDGHRGIEIAFDAWDPAKGQGGSLNPPVKTTQDQRLFYNYYTGDRQGFITGSSVLIADYWRTGGLFQNTWYRPTSKNSATYLYGSTYDAEHPWRHQRSLYARTAVALNSDNHLLLFVCDGKYPDSVGGVGMSCGWVQDFLYKYFNPQWALNLDGGGSSTMCVSNASDADMDSSVVNFPNDNYTGKRGSFYPEPSDGDTPRADGKSGNYDHDGERPRNSFIIVAPKNSF